MFHSQSNTLTALAEPTDTNGVTISDTITALADLETDSGPGLHLEPVTPGVWFTKRHKSCPVTGSDLQSATLMLHRDLLEAAEQLEAYTDQDKARDLYGAYLSVFSNREYESDYTPAEHLDHTVTPKESLAGLEDAGLIFHSTDEQGKNSTYFLTLFAGE